MVEQVLVTDSVQLVGRDTRGHVRTDLGQRPGGQPTSHSHPLDRLVVLHLRLADSRGAPPDILRAGDMRGDGAEGGYPAGLEGSRHDLEL